MVRAAELNSIFNLIKKLLAWCCFEFRQKERSVVFNSYENRRFDFNARYLFEHMVENHGQESAAGLRCWFVINDALLRAELERTHGPHFISSNSWSGLRTIFSAGCWVTSTGMPVRIPFASRDRTILNLWHGIPLKKVGALEQNISLVRRLVISLIYRNHYTWISTTSKPVAEVMARSFMCPIERVVIMGQPQNDILKCPPSLQVLQSELPETNLSASVKILYCPTYREGESTRLFPFEDFDSQTLYRFLEQRNAVILVRKHPLDTEQNPGRYLSDRCAYLGADIVSDPMTVLNSFDLLITDYSSIYLDFLLLDRPMLFLPYDLPRYQRERGLNFNYDSVTPGPKPSDFAGFLSELDKLLDSPNYMQQERSQVKALFHEFQGDSADQLEQLIVDSFN